MPSPNNLSPSEFFSRAQNASFHNCFFSNTAGHLFINEPSEGNSFQSLAQPSSAGEPCPPLEQMPLTDEYPIFPDHPDLAPRGKPKNPFAQGRIYENNPEIKATELPFTDSSNEFYSPPSPFFGDGPLQRQEENDEFSDAIHSVSWSSTNSSLVSLISDGDSDFPPSQTTLRYPSDAELYVNAMLPLRHGYPLPVPQPNSSLPVEKRRVGTMIGDLVTISDDGSIDYICNPLLPRTDPRNPSDLPVTFDEVFPPVALTSQIPSAFNSKSGIWSRGIHCDTERETMELSILHFSNSGGALLFLPDGASQEGLRNSGKMKEFIIKHAELWMAYAISTGRDIDHDSLYFVTGCTKARDWGMATFNPSMPWKTSSLKLGQSTNPNDPRYIWERSRGCGMARTGPGPDEGLDNERGVSQNQTLFVKGYKIAFSENAWARISAETNETLVTTAQSTTGWASDANTGSNQTSGGNQAPSSASARNNTFNCNRMNLESFPESDRLFHPLDTINRVLLEEIPEAEMAISHDDEWCEMTNEYDSIDNELVAQLLRSKCGASYYEGAAVLSTTQETLLEDDGITDLEMPTRGKKGESEAGEDVRLFVPPGDGFYSSVDIGFASLNLNDSHDTSLDLGLRGRENQSNHVRVNEHRLGGLQSHLPIAARWGSEQACRTNGGDFSILTHQKVNSDSGPKVLKELREQIKDALPINMTTNTVSAMTDLIRHKDATDDRKLLFEDVLSFISKLEAGHLAQTLKSKIIHLLHNEFTYPPASSTSKKYTWRPADGLFNKIDISDIRKEMRLENHSTFESGKSNVCSAKFKYLCLWHATTSQEDEQRTTKSFFFSRTEAGRKTLIATLADQLALSLAVTRHIELAIKQNPLVFSMSLRVQAQTFIIDSMNAPLNDPCFNTSQSRWPILIIDLDECNDPNTQREILDVLSRMLQCLPLALTMAMTSRPEHHISNAFYLDDLSQFSLDHTQNPGSDIQKFLVDKISNIRELHPFTAYLPQSWFSKPDIDRPISLHRQALDLELPLSPHHNRSTKLKNLATELSSRFEQLGQLSDLDEVISLHRQALELRLPPHPERSAMLNDLATALSRFEQQGQLNDLEEAISLSRQALDLELPLPPHPNRSTKLNNLASALSTEFQELVHIVPIAVSQLAISRLFIQGDRTKDIIIRLLGDERAGMGFESHTQLRSSDDMSKFVLRMLWDKLVQPVINFLDIKKSDEITVLQWCPTGHFTFLPIHAAVCYNDDLAIDCAPDYFTSSYAPTSQTLLAWNSAPTTQSFQIMALVELGIPGAPAGVEAVASRLSNVSIIHFACHGKQDPRKPLAFLCACENSRNRFSVYGPRTSGSESDIGDIQTSHKVKSRCSYATCVDFLQTNRFLERISVDDAWKRWMVRFDLSELSFFRIHTHNRKYRVIPGPHLSKPSTEALLAPATFNYHS